MEIKRRLNAVAKSFGPEAESLNIVHELRQICDRLEELAAYADLKLERHKQREKTGHRYFEEQDRKARERQAEIAAIHAAEAEEALKDQQQAKSELTPRTVEEPDAGGESAKAE